MPITLSKVLATHTLLLSKVLLTSKNYETAKADEKMVWRLLYAVLALGILQTTSRNWYYIEQSEG